MIPLSQHEPLGRALMSVISERIRQDNRWGLQRHDPLLWVAILTEEVGEVAKEVADASERALRVVEYRAELVQVAAVAVAAIESIDAQEAS
jgi:NTP pyrophosphatase (non-canonical NTP hydrolase)